MENGLSIRRKQIIATFISFIFALFAVTTFATEYQMFDEIY